MDQPGRDLIPAGEALVFLRRDEEGWTFFARVDDIPERQPAPPQRLPEYLVQRSITLRVCHGKKSGHKLGL